MPEGGAVFVSVNAGSSSLRLALHEVAADGQVTARAHDHGPPPGAPADVQARLSALLALSPRPPRAVIHRVVHGGVMFSAPTLVDDDVLAKLATLTTLAPLHMPKNLAGITAARTQLGAGVPQIAVFDTAFFAALPEVARHYALPVALTRRLGIRRYGFHGLAHQAMLRHWCEVSQRPPARSGRLVTLQLGSGCSIAAIADGQPVDTSMGFSPSEGLVMATRSGDVDPGLLVHLQRQEGLDADGLDELLNRRAGLLGLSGQSADMRVLLASDTADARLAVQLFCHRARKYVGAYAAVLGGLDAIVFGGGIGENAPAIRDAIVAGLDFLAGGRGVRVMVAAVDEAREMIGQALPLLP